MGAVLRIGFRFGELPDGDRFLAVTVGRPSALLYRAKIMAGRKPMNRARKSLIGATLCLMLVSLIVQPAFAAITLNGTVPVGRAGLVLIQENKQPKTSGVLKFKFSAPQAGAYAFNFCIGPASNPCGLPSSYVVVVPGGEERLAVVDASVFTDKVLTVGQGTNQPLPFSVTIE